MDLPNPGIQPRSPPLQAGSLHSEPPGKGCFIKINGGEDEGKRETKAKRGLEASGKVLGGLH